jgi:diguanylate cyclase (GGDEF)-like protein/PAS domain S-box-containing protein
MSDTTASPASAPGSISGILAEAVELSHSAIAITDPDGALLFANPRFREVAACPIEEAAQARPILWQSEGMPPEVHADLWRTLKAGRVWRGILHGKRPNGDLYCQSAVIVPMRDSGGRVLHYLQVSEDVTGREAIESLAEKSAEASAESRRRVAELERMALTDDLTGLFNRRGFEQEMRRIWALAARRQEPVSIMVIDIDNFKGVNDLRGHPVGDRAIREVALLLQREFRVSDVLCRWGGDEMIAVLPFTDLQETRGIAERVLSNVRSQAFCEGTSDLHITVSVGAAATLVEAGVSPESLLMQADQAMFRAKQEGRNKACFADDHDTALAVRPAEGRAGRGRGRILLVEDDLAAGRVLCRLFQAEGFEVELFSTVEDVRRRIHIQPAPYDILMADLYLDNDSGIDLFREVHSHDPCIVGIIITGSSTVENAIEALRAGAFDFLAKPIDLGYAIAALDRAMGHRWLLVENRRYQSNLEKMVRDKSAALVHALERARSTFLFTMEALAEIRAHSGTQFDPKVVDALADCQDEIERSIQWPDAGDGTEAEEPVRVQALDRILDADDAPSMASTGQVEYGKLRVKTHGGMPT